MTPPASLTEYNEGTGGSPKNSCDSRPNHQKWHRPLEIVKAKIPQAESTVRNDAAQAPPKMHANHFKSRIKILILRSSPNVPAQAGRGKGVRCQLRSDPGLACSRLLDAVMPCLLS